MRQKHWAAAGISGKWTDDPLKDLFAEEVVTHQHPCHEQAKHHIHQSRNQRRTKRQAIRGHHARAGNGRPKLVPGEREGFEHQRRERDQHNQAQVRERETQGDVETRQHARRPMAARQRKQGHEKLLHRIDLVELTAIIEVDFLRLAEGTEILAHGHQLDRLERRRIFLQQSG